MIRGLVALGISAVVVATAAHASPDTAARCPAPKPLPASVKRPPKGATATALANFLLALPQRKPCDIGLFTSEFQPGPWPGLYTEGPRMEALPIAPATEAQVRSQLDRFLKGTKERAAALAVFDRPDVKAKMPEPTLRAALANLSGTIAEPAIELFLRTQYSAVPRFGGLPIRQIGRAQGSYTDGRTAIIVSSRYTAEHFALLSPMVAHEILHHDERVNYAEEILLNAVTAVHHTQQLSRHPALATLDTELSRYMNEWVLLFANSRHPGTSRSALVAPRGKGVAPGSKQNVPDFSSYMRRAYEEAGIVRGGTPDVLPAPSAFGAIVQRVLLPGSTPKPPTFSPKTVALFSKMNDTWLSPVERLRVSVLLGLVSVDEIVEYTGLPRGKAISTFALASILAAAR